MPSNGPSDESPPQIIDIPAELEQLAGDANAYVETLKKCWATGSRLEFLTLHVAKYVSSLTEGRSRANDYLDIVVNTYFTRFHWKLKVSEEPPVNESPVSHFSETLTPLESLQKQHKIASMRKTIRNWLDNRSKGLRKLGAKTKPENNPWTRLLSQLSGVAPNKPRTLQAHQRWSKDFYESAVKERFEVQWGLSSCPPKEKASFHDRVTRTIFEEQDPLIIKQYQELAKTEGKEAIKQWKAMLEDSPPTDPVSRQAALDRLASFAGPLLSGISLTLGMHISLMVSRPKPRKQGKISVISMHKGVDLRPQPQNWQTADRKKFKTVTKLWNISIPATVTQESRSDRKLPDVPADDMADPSGPPAHPNSDTDITEVTSTMQKATAKEKGKSVKRPAKSKHHKQLAADDDDVEITTDTDPPDGLDRDDDNDNQSTADGT
ncbi:hypothetical protein C8R48DRAFT_779410 [Suillus tomentosus]|nr:hypothetical protein C8R48DRAFT_779410 [Suillus tomentosus]